jgi:hypothetical protein
MSAYLHSLSIVVAVEQAEPVRGYFVEFQGGNVADALPCRLSANGLEPATHVGSHTVVTEPVRLGLVELLTTGELPASLAYLIVPNALGGRIVGTNLPETVVDRRSTFITLAAALGLKLILPLNRSI